MGRQEHTVWWQLGDEVAWRRQLHLLHCAMELVGQEATAVRRHDLGHMETEVVQVGPL